MKFLQSRVSQYHANKRIKCLLIKLRKVTLKDVQKLEFTWKIKIRFYTGALELKAIIYDFDQCNFTWSIVFLNKK